MPGLKTEWKAVAAEAVVVVAAGLALALAANALSRRGLSLSRNYFPAAAVSAPVQTVPASVPAAAPSAAVAEPSEAEQLSARLRDKGLKELKLDQVEKCFHDPRMHDQRIVFVDARDPEHFREGHVPGAFEFDPYHPENQIGTVLPACQAAEQVVVYCTGGECEDADTAAIFLRDAGIPAEKLFVYGGGYTEWNEHHLPLDTGGEKAGEPPNAQ